MIGLKFTRTRITAVPKKLTPKGDAQPKPPINKTAGEPNGVRPKTENTVKKIAKQPEKQLP
jgi:hypothetical protein